MLISQDNLWIGKSKLKQIKEWYWISTNFATFGIQTINEVVVETTSISWRSKGRSITNVLNYGGISFCLEEK